VPKFSTLLKSKLPVLAAVATVVAILSFGVHIHGSLYGAWTMFRFSPVNPLYADTRTITHSIDCLLSGQDPYFVTSFDPLHRVYNYPPIWLDARYLGVTSQSSNLIGGLMAIGTVGVFLLLFNSKRWVSAVIIFFAVLSRSVLFAIERGNTDQIIFALLVCGLLLAGRQRPAWGENLKGLLIIVLTILKIYPVVAVAVFIRRNTGYLKALLVAVISIAALIATSGRYLPIVLKNTPHYLYLSFGSYPFFFSMTKHVVPWLAVRMLYHVGIPVAGAMLLGALCMAKGATWGDRIGNVLPPLEANSPRANIAVACLAIFCFAFITGASFDYRLIFLLGALAYLVDDLNESSSLRSLPAAILILILMWKSPGLSPVFEVFDGLVFALACVWLGSVFFGHKTPAPVMESKRLESV
jgi:hypothetical protein